MIDYETLILKNKCLFLYHSNWNVLDDSSWSGLKYNDCSVSLFIIFVSLYIQFPPFVREKAWLLYRIIEGQAVNLKLNIL